jgi:ABC-type antimicrobial peptide transport system permease subunit
LRISGRRAAHPALRTLARRPSTPVITLLTIALGVGPTTAIFGVVHAVLIRPLPYPQPHALVGVWHSGVVQKGSFDWATYGALALWLVSACMLANYISARRALLVDPVEALKAE